MATAIRLRPGKKADPYSGEATADDWTTANRIPIEGCLFGPAESHDFPNADIDQLAHRGVLYAPVGADVAHGDRVVIDGAVWDVTGRPSTFPGSLVSGRTAPLKWVREATQEDLNG